MFLEWWAADGSPSDVPSVSMDGLDVQGLQRHSSSRMGATLCEAGEATGAAGAARVA